MNNLLTVEMTLIIKLPFQGRKTVRDRKILEVHVDKGMTDGQKIVFSGEGDQEPELEAGDLIIVLDEKEHEVIVYCYLLNIITMFTFYKF